MAPVTLAGLARAGTVSAGRRSGGSPHPTSKRAEKATARPKAPQINAGKRIADEPDFSEIRRSIEKGPSRLLDE